jgi:hypothetical protein
MKPLFLMYHLPASVRVYLCLAPCDMRKSFDSLQPLVRDHLELDAFAGYLFVLRTQFRLRRAQNVGVRSRRRNWERC